MHTTPLNFFDKSTTPKQVADSIAHLSDEERLAALVSIPALSVEEYLLTSDTIPSYYLRTILRTQFLIHHPNLFKPTLSELEPQEQARYAPLFRHQEGIYRYFKRHVLDVIDYAFGTRRVSGNIGVEQSTPAKAPGDRDCDIFSQYAIITDIAIAARNPDDGREKANAFIHAFRHLLKPCLINFAVVQEGNRTFVRTDMDFVTFSILGQIIATAAFLELTTEELVAGTREGQARLWQHKIARELGRVGLPGVCEMAIMGLPGISFRQNMGWSEKDKLQEINDPLYEQIEKIKIHRDIWPDLMYDAKGKRVLDTSVNKLPDGRTIHTLAPLENFKTHARSASYKALKKKFTLEGAFSTVTMVATGSGMGAIGNAGNMAFKALLKGLKPGWQAYSSKKIWDSTLGEMLSSQKK